MFCFIVGSLWGRCLYLAFRLQVELVQLGSADRPTVSSVLEVAAPEAGRHIFHPYSSISAHSYYRTGVDVPAGGAPQAGQFFIIISSLLLYSIPYY